MSGPGTYAQTSAGFRCEECGVEMAVPLFCDGCGADYPERRGMGPFALLGLPERFDLDESALDAMELRLAARLHPDRWTTRGERAHKHAQLAWSAVNGALGALRDPFDRAETLLRAAPEWPALEAERSALPTGFLVALLELQEEVGGRLSDERRAALKREVRQALRELQRRLAEHLAAAGGAAEGEEPGDARIAALRAARADVDAARYWRNAARALKGSVGI